MRELRFDGLSPDGTRLVLAGKDGQRYTVHIDERLEAAVRRDRARMSQVELEQSGMLRPREIQARIRAGATAEDVAAASGLPLEHVRRFEGPVLTERAWVAQQAQATEVRRPGGDVALGTLVVERLAALGVEASDVLWDAWRRDDGLWVVIATFPVPPNTHVATWTYDTGGRTMTVADDNARALSAIDGTAPLELVGPRPVLAAVSSLAEPEPEPEPEPDDEADPEPDVAVRTRVEERLSDDEDLTEEELELLTRPEALEDRADPEAEQTEAGDLADPGDAGDPAEEPEAEDAGAADLPLFEAPVPPTSHRPPGRPHVPSFDDILFGPGRPQ